MVELQVIIVHLSRLKLRIDGPGLGRVMDLPGIGERGVVGRELGGVGGRLAREEGRNKERAEQNRHS